MNFRVAISNPDAMQRVLPEGFNLHDPVLEKIYQQRQDDSELKEVRRLTRRLGGSWFCPGRCGERISATRELCAACVALKALRDWLGYE